MIKEPTHNVRLTPSSATSSCRGRFQDTTQPVIIFSFFCHTLHSKTDKDNLNQLLCIKTSRRADAFFFFCKVGANAILSFFLLAKVTLVDFQDTPLFKRNACPFFFFPFLTNFFLCAKCARTLIFSGCAGIKCAQSFGEIRRANCFSPFFFLSSFFLSLPRSKSMKALAGSRA